MVKCCHGSGQTCDRVKKAIGAGAVDRMVLGWVCQLFPKTRGAVPTPSLPIALRAALMRLRGGNRIPAVEARLVRRDGEVRGNQHRASRNLANVLLISLSLATNLAQIGLRRSRCPNQIGNILHTRGFVWVSTFSRMPR